MSIVHGSIILQTLHFRAQVRQKYQFLKDSLLVVTSCEADLHNENMPLFAGMTDNICCTCRLVTHSTDACKPALLSTPVKLVDYITVLGLLTISCYNSHSNSSKVTRSRAPISSTLSYKTVNLQRPQHGFYIYPRHNMATESTFYETTAEPSIIARFLTIIKHSTLSEGHYRLMDKIPSAE